MCLYVFHCIQDKHTQMKTIRRRVFKGGRSMDLLGNHKVYTLVYMTRITTTTSLQNFRENVDENFSCYPNKCSMEVHKLTLLLYSTKYNNNDKRHGTRKIYKFLIYTHVKHMPWPPPPIILLYLLKTIFYLSHILSNTCMMMMYYNYL